MPRVTFVKSARKDNPVAKIGEPYYWWSFRFGGKRHSLTPPRASQLTQSPYYGAVRALSESVSDFFNDNVVQVTDIEQFRSEIASELESIGSECQDSLDNMPESLQDSPTGEMLQERVSQCEEAASEIESISEFEGTQREDEPDLTFDEFKELSLGEQDDWLGEQESKMIELIDNCEV